MSNKFNKNEIISSLYDLVHMGKEFSALAYGFGARDAEKLGLDQTAMLLHEKTADKLLKEFIPVNSYCGSNYSSLEQVATHYSKASEYASKLGLDSKAKGLKKLAIENKNKSAYQPPRPNKFNSAAA